MSKDLVLDRVELFVGPPPTAEEGYVRVYRLICAHPYNAYEDNFALIGNVGPDKECTRLLVGTGDYQRSVQGSNILFLAKRLYALNLLVNYEGLCYFPTKGTVDPRVAKNQIHFYRINDRLDWTDFSASNPPTLVSKWNNRCFIGMNKVCINSTQQFNEVDIMKKTILELEAKIKDMVNSKDEDRRKLKEDLAASGRKADDLQVKISSNDKKIAELQNLVNSKDEEIRKFKEDLDASRKRVDDLQAQIFASDNKTAEQQDLVNSKDDAICKLKEDLSAFKKKVYDLQAKISTNDNKIVELQGLVNSKDEEIRKLKQELDMYGKKVDDLQPKMPVDDNRILELQDLVNSKDEEICKLKEDLEVDREDLNAYKKKVEDLQDKISAKDKKLTELQESIHSIDKNICKLKENLDVKLLDLKNSKDKEIHKLEKDLDDSKKKFDDLQNSKDEEIRKLKKDLDASKKKAEDLQNYEDREICKLKEELVVTKKKFDGLENFRDVETRKLKEDLDVSKKKIDDLQNSKAEEIHKLNKHLDECRINNSHPQDPTVIYRKIFNKNKKKVAAAHMFNVDVEPHINHSPDAFLDLQHPMLLTPEDSDPGNPSAVSHSRVSSKTEFDKEDWWIIKVKEFSSPITFYGGANGEQLPGDVHETRVPYKPIGGSIMILSGDSSISYRFRKGVIQGFGCTIFIYDQSDMLHNIIIYK